jgi:hypothetical protein
MTTHADTLTLTAPEYAAKVEAIRAPLLAEISAGEAAIAEIERELADCFDDEEREAGFMAIDGLAQAVDYARSLLPSPTPMWG